MKTLKFLMLTFFALLLGGAFAIATNTPSAFFAGPLLVGANEACKYFSGFSLTNILGINLANIDKNLTNGNNQGGTGVKFYYGVWDYVASWPSLGSADLEGLVTTTGNVTMSAGKYMYRLYGTMDSCELKFEPVGDIDGFSFKATLEIFHPGMQKKILGFMSYIKNENLFFIVTDREGQKYLLGDANLPVKFMGGGPTTGKKTDDRKGSAMQFVWYCNAPQVYNGTFTSGSGA